MAAVDEDGELDARRAAVVEERLDRGADRPARVEDVVDEHDRPSLECEAELRVADDRLRAARGLAAAHGDVVAVEGDVDGAELRRLAGALLDQAREPVRERDAARLDPDERDPGADVVGSVNQPGAGGLAGGASSPAELRVALDDLVGDSRKRPPERIG